MRRWYRWTPAPPNGYGLHNMTGNVWEWTADPFGAIGEPDGDRRVAQRLYLCHASYCRGAIPFCIVSSLKEPVSVPSKLAPGLLDTVEEMGGPRKRTTSPRRTRRNSPS